MFSSLIRELNLRIREYLDFEGIEFRHGKYRCINPAHDDSQPSMKVYDDHAYCFGCNTYYTTVTAYMTIHQVDEQTAIKNLCALFKIDPPLTRAELNRLKWVVRYVFDSLSDVDYSPETIRYLKSKGIGLKAARYHGVLQYDEDVMQNVKAAYPAEFDLLGLVHLRTDGFLYTIFDVDGDPIAFVARNFKLQPKFKNPQNNPLYRKSFELYGQHLVKHESVVLVEGYSDALSAWAHGKMNVLALGCASVSDGTVRRLRSLGVKRVALCLDGDDTGGEGTVRGVKKLIEAGFETYAAVLKAGEDPDDYFLRNERLPIEPPEVAVWKLTKDLSQALECVNLKDAGLAVDRLAEVSGITRNEIAMEYLNVLYSKASELKAKVEEAKEAERELSVLNEVMEVVKSKADVATLLGSGI